MPGEILWPKNGLPEWVIPNIGANFGWCDFRVHGPVRAPGRFAVGQEQFFDWPECDPFCFDDGIGSGDEGHTWFNYDGVWSKLESPNNLMLRVVIGEGGAVSPTSLGRIKGLYR